MLPSPGTFVELTADGEPLGGVRVVSSAQSSPAQSSPAQSSPAQSSPAQPSPAGSFTLSMPPAQAPAAGATVTLRWPAGMRGRYVVAVTVLEADESRVQVSPAGPVEIEQHRNFVRGGGGEQVLLCRPGQVDVLGWIRDISEQGVRAHFADVTLSAGDEIRLRVQLDEEIIEVPAVATKVGSLRQSLPQRGPMSVELVATLAPGESQAQTIRRYVFRQQLLARARAAN